MTSHMSRVGRTSSDARCVIVSGWSSPARIATSAPRSWPASANRSCPSAPANCDDVGSHDALGVGISVRVGGLVAVAVAAQVRADHRVIGRQVGGDMPPHQVGLREAVQQHDRCARSADRDVERHSVGDGDPSLSEAGDVRCHVILQVVAVRVLDPLCPPPISVGSVASQPDDSGATSPGESCGRWTRTR